MHLFTPILNGANELEKPASPLNFYMGKGNVLE